MPKPLADICKSSLEELKRELVLGSSNKKEDRIATEGWNVTLVNTSRYDYEFKKDREGKFSYFFNTETDGEKDIASVAVNAKLNRCGNCLEQTCLASILILNQLTNNGMLEKYEINFCSLGKPYDHAFLKITSRDEEKSHEMIVDPWMGKLFYDEKEYLQTLKEVLLKEAIAEDNDRQQKKYPNMLFSNPEFIQLCKEDEKNRPNIQIFFSLVNNPDKRKLIADFNDKYKHAVSEQYSSKDDESILDVLTNRSKLSKELKRKRKK